MPAPRVSDNRRQIGPFRRPTEYFSSLGRISHKMSGIARSPRIVARNNLAARDFPHDFDHLSDRSPAAAAQIDGKRFAIVEQMIGGEHVSVRETADMHIIAERRAIGRRIVRAKNANVRP
jgi:hypothetical protein